MTASPDPIRVLHVDDDEAFASLAATHLERVEDRLAVEIVTSAAAAREHLARERVDCVVSDHDMPGESGIEFLRSVRADRPDLPFILFTGKGSEEVASEAISAGVTDYLQKEYGADQYAVLANRIVNAVDRRAAERSADRSRRQLAAIADHTADAILIFDEESTVRFANAAVEGLFGYAPAELEGEPLTTIMPQRFRDPHLDGVKRYLETGERTMDWSAVEFPGLRRDGTECRLSISFGEFEQDGGRRFVGVLRDVGDERETQRQLRAARADVRAYERAVEDSVDLLAAVDVDGRLLFANEAYRRFHGLTDAAVGKPLETALGEQYDDRMARHVERALGGAVVRYEAERTDADGAERTLDVRYYPMRDGEGGVLGVVAAIRDRSAFAATERKHARERALLAAQRDALLDGVLVLDETGSVVSTNGRLYELWELEPGELEGTAADPLEVIADRTADPDAVHEVAAGLCSDAERTDRGTLELADGRVFERYTTPVIGEDGTHFGRLWTYRDVTEQRTRERELEQARAEYAELFDGMNETAWVLDRDGTVLAVNDAAIEETGFDREELVGSSIFSFDAVVDAPGAEEPSVDFVERVAGAGDREVLETVHRRGDGTTYPVEVSSSLITYRGDPAVLSVARDVSERKEREAQLEQFASVVSHDLRNPLNVAEGRLALLAEECGSEHLEHAMRALGRMNDLIDDLLTLAREGDAVGEREPVELGAVARECWRDVATEDAALVVDAECTILADRSRLRQLLENLFRNSVDHAGPDVSLTVTALGDGFAVEDDGPGIAPELRDSVFDLGSAGADGGTGFGLSIVAQIVAAHGWSISLGEGADGGARFEITDVDVVE